jgi:hypothetical protein
LSPFPDWQGRDFPKSPLQSRLETLRSLETSMELTSDVKNDIQLEKTRIKKELAA